MLQLRFGDSEKGLARSIEQLRQKRGERIAVFDERGQTVAVSGVIVARRQRLGEVVRHGVEEPDVVDVAVRAETEDASAGFGIDQT